MLPQEVIRKKRDGRELDAGEIAGFVAGLTARDVTREQAAAFAMAAVVVGFLLLTLSGKGRDAPAQ